MPRINDRKRRRGETARRATPPSRMPLRLVALTGGVGLVALALCILAYGGWIGRWTRQTDTFALTLSQKAGFRIVDVRVEGRRFTSRDALLTALEATSGAPLLAFDPVAARDRLRRLPWIADAVVTRQLPNALIVQLSERQPIARWQNAGRTIVIDHDGHEVPNANLDQFSALPLVVGDDAPAETPALLSMLKDFPTVAIVMKSAVRAGNRRWNLYLRPNLLVRLPEDDPTDALKRLAAMIREDRILERNVAAVDLRVPERLFIETNDQASMREAKGPPL